MKHITTLLFSAALLLFAVSAAAQESKPRWVQKGVNSLNKNAGEDYSFMTFTTSGIDVNKLKAERLEPLLEQLGSQYGVSPERMSVDTLAVGVNGRTTYRISFPSDDGYSEVYAQQVDEWSRYNDDIDNWTFEMKQLYAVSDRNSAPDFDEFELTAKYGAAPAFMSLIPGLGQIHKGQPGKGYAILGTEVALVGISIAGAVSAGYYNRLANENPQGYDSYQSRADSFRQMRNVGLIAGGALYLYNIIDAAVAKGARRVVVETPGKHNAEIAFVPAVSQLGVGVGMTLRF